MTGLHVDDVFRGGRDGGALEIEIPHDLPVSLRGQISVDRLFLILLNLASHANEKSLAFPSVRTICAETRIQERKVRVGLRILGIAGLITRVSPAIPGRRGVTYRLNLPSFVLESESLAADADQVHTRRSRGQKAATNPFTKRRTFEPTVSRTVECADQNEEQEQKRRAQKELDFYFNRFLEVYPSHGLNGHARIAFNAAAASVPSWQIVRDLQTALEGLGSEEQSAFPMASAWINERFSRLNP